MARLRFGIIGAGGIARTHAKCLRGLEDTAELVAVADAVPEAAARFGQEFGVQTYGGPDAVHQLLARADIDAVSLATPSGLHADQSVMSLQAGKHVLTEKPLAITLEQADRMIAAERASGKALGCVYQNRLQPGAQLVHEAITQGHFGKILHANSYLKWYRSQAYYDAGGWRGTWAMDGGGALMNQSVHYIDMMQWLAGPVRAISAYAGTLHHRIETEDAAVAVLRFHSGALGTIEGMTNAIAGTYDRVEVFGTEGMAAIEGSRLVRYYTTALDPKPDHKLPGGNLAEQVLERYATEHPGVPTGHTAAFAGFIDAVREGRPAPVNAVEAKKALEIILGIYRSSQQRTEVILGE